MLHVNLARKYYDKSDREKKAMNNAINNNNTGQNVAKRDEKHKSSL